MSTNQNLRQHMRELIDRIKAADVAYYRDDNPTMTDREYDLLVDELKELETTTGLILSGSPTQTVPGEILKELMPVRHTKPMLSADKTKSVDEMLRFANGRPVVLSWKLDGLTIVLRYEGGELKQAITRGREGIIGEDVTHTVRTFMNVPMCIPCTDKFEVRGEGVISWAHFEKINLSLSEPYSHPRNLAAGSVRMLDARESGKRYLEFFAFDLISDSIEEQSKTAQLQFLAENGFDVVPYVYTDAHDADELRKLIADFKPAEYGYPVDGVIMEYDNLVYAEPVWKKHVVYTTKQLLDKLCELDGKPISVSFWDNRTVMHPPTRRKNDSLNHNELSEYYVLRADQGFFVKRSSRRIWFARKISPTAASVRKFRTEKAAQRYLDDNAKFFAKIAFQIEHIQNGGDAI